MLLATESAKKLLKLIDETISTISILRFGNVDVLEEIDCSLK